MNITTGDCVACGACVSICPRNSITLEKNDMGFYMPMVNAQSCVECGQCQKVCPVNHRPEGNSWEDGTYYAMWANNAADRQSGSSGGIFGLLSEQTLSQGGVVFGAAYSENMHFVYQTSTDNVSLDMLKKSKYVESYTGAVFSDVRSALESGRQVLYCGTSCQIDGLKNYLKKNYANLLTCDFLCYGVPASGIFEKYIADLEAKYGNVSHVDFRSKSYGWKSYCAKVQFRSGKTYLKTLYQDPYLRIIFSNTALREACYHCTRLRNSLADLTLGDFWRVAEAKDIPDTNQGISLVGVHTAAGQAALNNLTSNSLCFCKQLPKERYSYAYHGSSQKPADRDRKLQSILEQDNMLNAPVSLKIKIKGFLYWGRAKYQKIRTQR